MEVLGLVFRGKEPHPFKVLSSVHQISQVAEDYTLTT